MLKTREKVRGKGEEIAGGKEGEKSEVSGERVRRE